MSRSPFGLINVAVDEPKGDPAQQASRGRLARTDLHVSPYPDLQVRSYADNGIRRQLGCGWRTVWDAIRPILAKADQDPSRFDGVTILGVDEHVVRHEALLFRMEVRDLHRLAVAAAG